MNEIARIHIAGVAYEIDTSAKKQLDKYMHDIRESLGEASDAIDDIEIRITEILAERGIKKNDVIRPLDVTAVKEQLGEPKDFSSESKSKTGKGGNIADQIRASFADKKYFRDIENGMLGGVIAGFAAYTGWDVTLLRVLFVVFAIFTTGFPFILFYIVVWICAPEARTASDRLSMKGEPINLKTIKTSAEKSSGKDERTADNLAVRVILAFFGVIGLMIFIPCLIALIPLTVLGILNVISATIAMKPLFIVSAALMCALAFVVVSLGLTVSGALLSAKFTRSTGIGIVVSIILAIVLMAAALVTGSIWYHKVGPDSAIDSANSIVDNLDIEVNDDNGHNHVKLDLGPIHIDTKN